MSRPAEDICQYCYTFANRHRYLSRQSGKQTVDDECESEAEDDEVLGDISSVLASLNIDGAESAATMAAVDRVDEDFITVNSTVLVCSSVAGQ